MSLYASTALTAIDALSGASADAAAESTYNATYAAYAQQASLMSNRHTAELNITAAKEDEILTNTNIQMSKNAAKADALVAAAASGVSGGSVDDTINQVSMNAALAVGEASRTTDQAVENQLSTIGSATSAMLAVDTDIDTDANYLDGIAGLLSTTTKEEWTDFSSLF